MSGTASPDLILKDRGVGRDLGAFIVAARFGRDGRHAAFVLGDGTLHVANLSNKESWREVAVH